MLLKLLRLLLIEDSEDDAMLLELGLRNGGFDTDFLRVETPDELESALESKTWDAVIAATACRRLPESML